MGDFEGLNFIQIESNLDIKEEELGTDESKMDIKEEELGTDERKLVIKEEELGTDESKMDSKVELGTDENKLDIKEEKVETVVSSEEKNVVLGKEELVDSNRREWKGVEKNSDDAAQQKKDDPQTEGSPTSQKPDGAKSSKVTENDVGISEYLGDHKGFFGIIKQRYSDFLVNEVDSNGDVVHLTDTTIPPIPEDPAEMPAEFPPELTPEVLQQLDDLVGIPRPARIPVVQQSKISDDSMDTDVVKDEKSDMNLNNSTGAMLAGVADHQKQMPKKSQGLNEVMINVNGVSKEGRANIHLAVKAKYKSVVSAFKEEKDGNKYIVVQSKKAAKKVFPTRSSWPRSQIYTTFVLYKENIDTLEAINVLAKETKFRTNNFAYAGTKDRRAKTSQLVSVPRGDPKRLRNAVSYKSSIHLGNFRFLSTPQKLGQLRGNKFRIVLREVKGDDDTILSAIESLKTKGFINYYGSQRFGTTNISTHTIGLELLKSNWHKAINLILAPRTTDNPTLNEVRRIWKKTGSAEDALRVLKSDRLSSIEGKLLMGLRDLKKNDLVGALGEIPRNVRLLYLHAYQSYIWNRIISRRIAKYGLEVFPGDLVLRKNMEGAESEDFEKTEEEDEGIEDKEEEPEKKNGNEKNGVNSSKYRTLSEEEAKDASIYDVFMPLPGHDIELPQNEMKDWYVEMLEADGLTLAGLKHRVKCYSIGGAYRRLVLPIPDVSGRIGYYDDPKTPLVPSDMDELSSETVADNLLEKGENKAVVLEMTLPASAYATMALREVLKMDTSSSFQTTLNTTHSWASGSSKGHNEGDRSKKDFHHRGRDESSHRYQDHRGRDESSHRYKEHRGREEGSHRYQGRGGSHRGRGGNRGGRGGFHSHKGGRGEKRPWRGSQGGSFKRGRY